MREVPTNQNEFHTISHTRQKIRVLFFASIGNFLELYDYTLYAVMLSTISPKIFPSESETTSLLFGMLSFAVTMLICPLGAWFWGWYGDRKGRLPMLKQSIMLMALPSLIIALLPTYYQIGALAPVIFIFCRILQAISASGEVMGGKIFAFEHIGSSSQGLIAGLSSFAGSLGVLLAMAMGLLVSLTGVSWRIPFLLGSSLAIVGVMIRRKVTESPEFIAIMKNKATQKQPSAEESALSILTKYPTQAIIVTTLGALLGILSYTMHAFFNPFLRSLGYSQNTAYSMGILGLIICAIASISTGIIIDKKHNAKALMKTNVLFCIFAFPITFALIILSAKGYGSWLLYAAYMLLGGTLGTNATCSSITMYQLFKPENRCRGTMICYALGVAVFGGFTPLVLELLNKIDHFMPAIILTMAAIIIHFIYNRSLHETSVILSVAKDPWPQQRKNLTSMDSSVTSFSQNDASRSSLYNRKTHDALL